MSIVLLIGGTTVAIIFASYEESSYTIKDIEARFTALESILFVSCYLFFGIVCLSVCRVIINSI